MRKTEERVSLLELTVPLLALVFAFYYMFTVWGTPWEAQIYARILSAGILIFGLVLVVQVLFKHFRAEGKREEPGLLAKASAWVCQEWRSASLYLSAWIYLILIWLIGYPLATIIFLLGTIRYLGEKNKLIWIFTSVAIALAAYFLFVLFLQLRLPRGLFWG